MSFKQSRQTKRKAEDEGNPLDEQDSEGVSASSSGSVATRTEQPKKQRVSGKGKRKNTERDAALDWPEYFQSLFKIFKALNTVLAFVSSRKHLATTFPVIRSSVESLLQHPLDMSQVADLKALLPDLIKFAYIPQNEHRVNDDDRDGRSSRPNSDRTQDHMNFTRAIPEAEEHVLVLEFADDSKGKKINQPGSNYTLPPALTPQAVKKLVERRNERFAEAIRELLQATPDSDDPVLLLQAAGRDHIPINPIPTLSVPFSDSSKERSGIPKPEHRSSIDSVIEEITQQEWYRDQIVERRSFQAREGRIGEPNPKLSDATKQALQDSRKIVSLYTHQVAAVDAIYQGLNVIVSTSTASGKSVVYQIPVLRFLEENRDATAIFIYPTKALAQDQRSALGQIFSSCPGLQDVKVYTYDGDTPQEQRTGIRETASVIFTNFDMLHTSILPHEELWRSFLKNLRLVVVDELHYYSGLFGSHVALVMRRFRRICAAVGNRRIQFVSCTATISKPLQHMARIFGITDIVEITEDGAPSGPKDFIVWDPPLIDPLDPGAGQRSSLSEATGLMRFLMKRGIRAILFCKIRKVCELAMKTLRTDLSAEGRLDVLERVMPYRGGYSQQDRRRIEKEAFSGNLLGIVATNALELGVDIGVLDAVIMLGFPLGIANFRQQAGRAGRRARDSLVVFVADNLSIDRHYVNFPNDLFDKATDDLVIDLESQVIVDPHLQCASYEMPLSEEDEVYFGPCTRELCEAHLIRDKDGWYHTHPKYLPFPAKYVSLRGAEEDKYIVVDVSKGGVSDGSIIVEEVEVSRALFEIYEGGVFIHQGLTFIVKEVDHDKQMAKVIRSDVSWITSPRDFTNIDPMQIYRIREIRNSPSRAYYGRVELKTEVYGFYKVRNSVILDVVDLETPRWDRESTGFWVDVPNHLLDLMHVKGINAAEAIHAAQHAFLNRFAMAADLKTECKVPEKEYKTSESQRKRPGRLIFYDSPGHGGGIAVKAFDHVSDILLRAEEATAACVCKDGCSNCVHSPSCKEGNEVCSKLGGLLILKGILDLSIDADSIPDAFNTLKGFNTIVEAREVHHTQGIQIESP